MRFRYTTIKVVTEKSRFLLKLLIPLRDHDDNRPIRCVLLPRSWLIYGDIPFKFCFINELVITSFFRLKSILESENIIKIQKAKQSVVMCTHYPERLHVNMRCFLNRKILVHIYEQCINQDKLEKYIKR